MALSSGLEAGRIGSETWNGLEAALRPLEDLALALGVLLVVLPAPALAGVSLGLSAEAPILHSPIARYSGEEVAHGLPISVGARADLGFGIGKDLPRSLLVGLGARSAAVDLGRLNQLYLDLAYRQGLQGTVVVHPWWEAGIGAELIELSDHQDQALGLHAGPRFFGGLGFDVGANRLRMIAGLRASFTAATGDFVLDDETVVGSSGEDVLVERYYTPAALVLSGTLGLKF